MSKPIYALKGPNLNLLRRTRLENYHGELPSHLEVWGSHGQFSAACRTAVSKKNVRDVESRGIRQTRVDACVLTVSPSGYSRRATLAVKRTLASAMSEIGCPRPCLQLEIPTQRRPTGLALAKRMVAGCGPFDYELALEAAPARVTR